MWGDKAFLIAPPSNIPHLTLKCTFHIATMSKRVIQIVKLLALSNWSAFFWGPTYQHMFLFLDQSIIIRISIIIIIWLINYSEKENSETMNQKIVKNTVQNLNKCAVYRRIDQSTYCFRCNLFQRNIGIILNRKELHIVLRLVACTSS